MPLPPGGAAAIDEEVDRGVDPQEKVVRTRHTEKIAHCLNESISGISSGDEAS